VSVARGRVGKVGVRGAAAGQRPGPTPRPPCPMPAGLAAACSRACSRAGHRAPSSRNPRRRTSSALTWNPAGCRRCDATMGTAGVEGRWRARRCARSEAPVVAGVEDPDPDLRGATPGHRDAQGRRLTRLPRSPLSSCRPRFLRHDSRDPPGASAALARPSGRRRAMDTPRAAWPLALPGLLSGRMGAAVSVKDRRRAGADPDQ
jgi:hypothetical protein